MATARFKLAKLCQAKSKTESLMGLQAAKLISALGESCMRPYAFIKDELHRMIVAEFASMKHAFMTKMSPAHDVDFQAGIACFATLPLFAKKVHHARKADENFGEVVVIEMPVEWKAAKDISEDDEGHKSLETFMLLIQHEVLSGTRVFDYQAMAVKHCIDGAEAFVIAQSNFTMSFQLGMKDIIDAANKQVFERLQLACRYLNLAKNAISAAAGGAVQGNAQRKHQVVSEFVHSLAKLVGTTVVGFLKSILSSIDTKIDPGWEAIMSSGHAQAVETKLMGQAALDLDHFIGAANQFWSSFKQFSTGCAQALSDAGSYLAQVSTCQTIPNREKSYSGSIGALSMVFFDFPPLSREERSKEKVKT